MSSLLQPYSLKLNKCSPLRLHLASPPPFSKFSRNLTFQVRDFAKFNVRCCFLETKHLTVTKSNSNHLNLTSEHVNKTTFDTVSETISKALNALKGTAIVAVLLGLLLMYNHNVKPSLAASGGRMGGSSFSSRSSKSSSSSKSYSAPSSTSPKSSLSSKNYSAPSSSSKNYLALSPRSSKDSSSSKSYSASSSRSSKSSSSSENYSALSPRSSKDSSSSKSYSAPSSRSSKSFSPSKSSSLSKSYSAPSSSYSSSISYRHVGSSLYSEVSTYSTGVYVQPTLGFEGVIDADSACIWFYWSVCLVSFWGFALCAVICLAIYIVEPIAYYLYGRSVDGSEGGVRTDIEKTSVLKLQVGLLGTARSLQCELNQIAEVADTSSSEGLSFILTETTLALLRHSDYCISCYSSVDVDRSKDDGEKRFNRLSIEERGNFDEETLVNVSNIRRRSKTIKEASGFNNEYIVITILVAAEGVHKLPLVNVSKDLKEALQKLGSIPTSKILAVEVLWTPQDDDTLSEREFLEKYPRLRSV